MKIHMIVVSPVYNTNCYIVSCDRTQEAIVIDAGAEAGRIMEYIDGQNLQLKYLINTHAHVDHVGAVAEIQKTKNVPFYLHEKEKEILAAAPGMASAHGQPFGEAPDITEFIDPEKTYRVGESAFRILEVPGHSPGSVCLVFDENVFVGDTIFRGGIAPTNIPWSSEDLLIESIKTKLFALDEDMVAHTGHGAVTTIGLEKMSNPFIK